MSGIVGILRRDGEPAQERDLQAMVQSIAHRGPDGNAAWLDGRVGLGHAMLHTTPESLHETLPFWTATAQVCITADARLDNRSDLISTLRLEGSHAEISDSQLILHAYQQWGTDCPKYFVGDFVFAIWDKRNGQLFCARDPMGIKCLYYFSSGTLFALSSEIKGLSCLPDIPARLNELRVLDYLANLFDDREITFYQGIHRLPAASGLVVTADNLKLFKYWSLDPVKELRLASDQEYTEAFHHCFFECVKSAMRSAYPVGAALSGGLDSSSIACTARKLRAEEGSSEPLPTFSLIFPSLPTDVLSQIDERSYMEDVLAQGGFDPSFIRADEISPLRNVEKVQHHFDEAYFQGNMYLHWAMYEKANRKGVRVFLDGTDGDTTVSHGHEYLADLVVNGRWRTLTTELQLFAKQMQTTPQRIFREYCVKPFCPTWVYTAWRKLHGRPADAGELQTFMTPEFLRRMNYSNRIAALIHTKRRCFATAREKHHAMLSFPLYAHALEAADKAAAAFKIEARYPFFDKRLIELCLSLPAGQKLSGGWSRAILRRAMAGILPESIRWRQSKSNLSSNFYMRLIDQDSDVLEDVLVKDSTELEPYVDLVSIRKAYRAYQSNPLRSHDDSVNIFSAVNLAIWLRTAGVRP